MKKEYIGFFDSGLGGLTVLKEVRKLCPSVDIVYFGDNRNAPYGDRSLKEIEKLSKEAFSFLKEKNADFLLTACNSVSAIMTEKIAKESGFDNFLEMSIPTINYCLKSKLDNILILSTEATKKSGLYSEPLKNKSLRVKSSALSGLVDLIEANERDEKIESFLEERLTKIKNLNQYQNIILACTHFPLVEDKFKKVLRKLSDNKINIINPAVYVVQKLKEKVKIKDGKGEVGFYFSDAEKVNQALLKKYK